MSLDRERLAKLLGMIGSSFDAEALSAARRANELVHEAKTTWHEVLGQITPNGTKSNGSVKPNDRPSRDGAVYDLNDARDIAAAIILCTAMGSVLSTREKRFVRSMAEYNESCYPTDKQLAVLARLLCKVCPNVKVYPRRTVKRNPSELRGRCGLEKTGSPSYAGLRVRIHLPPPMSPSQQGPADAVSQSRGCAAGPVPLRDVRKGRGGCDQTPFGPVSLSPIDAVPLRQSSGRSQRRAGPGGPAACGIFPGCAAQLASSLRCSLQSRGRSSSVRRVAVSATGCRPCRIASTSSGLRKARPTRRRM